jgi:nucleoside-diphosphate-sugar epimerase
MKFIVTGGAGFIGHNVVSLLEDKGHQCQVIDSQTGYGFVPLDELTYLLENRQKKIGGEVADIDIREKMLVDRFFKQHSDADCVIHLASFPRQKVVSQNPLWGAEVMAPGLINLLEATKQNNISKFVYISSSMVYGDFDNDVTEESPCNPIGQYGIMKYMGEQMVKDYHRRGCFDYTIIRPSAVYGEWDVEDRVVSKFMLGAMRGDTLKVRGANEVLDFTYVRDAAMGIVLAASKPEGNNKIFNITRSDKKLYTLTDAANIAISIAGKGNLQVEGKDADFPSRGRLDISHAINVLGYAPTIGVEDGFRMYYEWFKTSDYWQAKINK